jgi:hypothetical protein
MVLKGTYRAGKIKARKIGVVVELQKSFQPDVILNAATAGRGTLRPPMLWMPWAGVPPRHAGQALCASVQPFASVQPMSGLRKVPLERLARSCGMTSSVDS